jgi:hypothetical protein
MKQSLRRLDRARLARQLPKGGDRRVVMSLDSLNADGDDWSVTQRLCR